MYLKELVNGMNKKQQAKWQIFCTQRAEILQEAITEFREWVHTDNPKGDLTWFEKLDSKLDIEGIKAFFNAFMLSRIGWDYQSIQSRLQTDTWHDPNVIEEVGKLATQLMQSTKRKHKQTSAASKLLVFLRPSSQVFIWDRHARESARYHSLAFSNKKLIADHTYPDFAEACDTKWKYEKLQPDYLAALAAAKQALLNSQSAQLSRIPAATDEFLERRFLDKLMFCEGRRLNVKNQWQSDSVQKF